MAKVTLVPRRGQAHPIEYIQSGLDVPPTVDFGAYLYNEKFNSKLLIRWPYAWLRYHYKDLAHIIVKEYSNGKTELRVELDSGEFLIEWFDDASVALRRSWARKLPKYIPRTVLLYQNVLTLKGD
jgi:hypothetical protein